MSRSNLDVLTTYGSFFDGKFTKDQVTEHMNLYLAETFVMHTPDGATQIPRDHWIVRQQGAFDAIGAMTCSENKFTVLENGEVLWACVPILGNGDVQPAAFMRAVISDGKLGTGYLLTQDAYEYDTAMKMAK